jgi:hypothetical protein
MPRLAAAWVVALHGEPLGKPADAAQAREWLAPNGSAALHLRRARRSRVAPGLGPKSGNRA